VGDVGPISRMLRPVRAIAAGAVARERGVFRVLLACFLAAFVVPAAAAALPSGDITSVAGGGSRPPENGVSALEAFLPGTLLAVDQAGDTFYAKEEGNSQFELIEVPAMSGTNYGIAMTAGDVYTIAGLPFQSTSQQTGDGGPATEAELVGAQSASLAVDSAGDLFISEINPGSDGDWVREIPASSGTHFGVAMTADHIYAIAGTGSEEPVTENGIASESVVKGFVTVGADSSGDLFIADEGNGANYDLQEVPAASGTHYGLKMTADHLYTIDGTFAFAAGPTVDAAGDVFFRAGTLANEGVDELAAVSGTEFGISMTADQTYRIGGRGFAGEGSSETLFPHFENFAIDGAGDLLIAENGFAKGGGEPDSSGLLKELPSTSGTHYGVVMTAGHVYRIAGTGESGYEGDGGPALEARLGAFLGPLALDSTNDILIEDGDNNRVREVVGQATISLEISGTVSYESEGKRLPVEGALVQACAVGGACTVNDTTSSNGAYSLTAPSPGKYIVSAYPSPKAISGLANGSTEPLTVTETTTGVDVTLASETTTPEGETINGQTGTVPFLNWASPTELSLQGCPEGVTYVSVTGRDVYTDEFSGVFGSLTESPEGSGSYSATLPPLYPLHGNTHFTTYNECPAPSALIPASGSAAGGTSVEISGSGFSGATGVMFGSMPATSFAVVSDSIIDAVAPPGSGAVQVKVLTPEGEIASSELGEYTYAAISAINPEDGGTAGGEQVTITGSGLGLVDAVFFGGNPATEVEVISETELKVVTPPGEGTVEVNIISEEGGEAEAGHYSYEGVATAHTVKKPADGANATDTLRSAQSSGAAATTLRASPFGKGGGSLQQGLRPDQAFLDARAWLLGMFKDCNVPQALADDIWNAIKSTADTPDHFVDHWVSPGGGVGGGLESLLGPLIGDQAAQAAANAAAAALSGGSKDGGGPNASEILAALDCMGKKLPPPPKKPGKGKGGTGKGKPKRKTGGSNGKTDPSGSVQDTNGNPIEGASATLERSDSEGGPFSAPPSGSPIMEPPENPETTNVGGQFMWDVVAGYYKVKAEKTGCFAPGEPSQPAVSTPALVVPPPRVALVLEMSCSGEPPPARPTVTGLSIASGPGDGGTEVDVSGSGFTKATTVSFGTTPAAAVSVLSPGALRVTAPAGAGTEDIRALTAGGQSATSTADEFTYLAVPEVSGLTPASGPQQGGTAVHVRGSGFEPSAQVSFGGQQAVFITYVSSEELVAVTPPGTGAVDVTATTAGGTSSTGAADQFTFQAPAITAISPSSGRASGGTIVTVTGSGFTGAGGVKFGSTPAQSFEVGSDSSITAVAPAKKPGSAAITVTVAGVTSLKVKADVFRYLPESPPELGRCVKVAKGGGKFASGCAVHQSAGSFEWLPEALKRGFSSSGGKSVLETATKTQIICGTEQTSGEYSGSKQVSNVTLTLSGCELKGAQCTSVGAGEGEVRIEDLEGMFGWNIEEKNAVALDLFALDKAPHLVDASCGATAVSVDGSILASVTPANAMSPAFKLTYKEAKGKQKPDHLEGEAADALELSLAAGPFLQAGLSIQSTTSTEEAIRYGNALTSEEPLEINTVV
jgi:IPT/TIG domain